MVPWLLAIRELESSSIFYRRRFCLVTPSLLRQRRQRLAARQGPDRGRRSNPIFLSDIDGEVFG